MEKTIEQPAETTDSVSSETEQCPECQSTSTRQNDSMAELVCEDCGCVIEEGQVDPGPEWRAFNSQEQQQKSRVGSPTTITRHDKGLTTTIDWKDQDAYGRSLSPEKRNQMRRLRKWQGRIRTQNSNEQNLQFALSEIDRMASALGLPQSVRETACMTYRRALEEDLIRGRSIEGVASACVYIACRRDNVPRSLDEILKVSRREEKKTIGRTYRYLASEMKIAMEPVNPKRFIPRFCSELGMSSNVEQEAKRIIDKTAEKGMLSGKSPTGYAAAAIYSAGLICNEKSTQREVADVAEVTEVTIRTRYQEQMKEIDF